MDFTEYTAWTANEVLVDTSPFMIFVDIYTMDRQRCPRERPLGKTREVGLEGSEGSFPWGSFLGVFPWDIIDGP